MGWGRMLLLGNIGQQLDIHEAGRELEHIREHLEASGRFNHEVSDYLKKLAAENAELRLYLAATIKLLTEKNVIHASELSEIVTALDASDGKADKRFSGDIAPA
jgi:hypothetical protein